MKCSSCRRVFTLHDWLLLTFAVRYPALDDEGPLELRNCRHCGSSVSEWAGEIHRQERALAELQHAAADAVDRARWSGDVDAERRALVWVALLDRAQGFDHRRRDHLRELYDIRDYRRRMRSMAAWRASQGAA